MSENKSGLPNDIEEIEKAIKESEAEIASEKEKEAGLEGKKGRAVEEAVVLGLTNEQAEKIKAGEKLEETGQVKENVSKEDLGEITPEEKKVEETREEYIKEYLRCRKYMHKKIREEKTRSTIFNILSDVNNKISKKKVEKQIFIEKDFFDNKFVGVKKAYDQARDEMGDDLFNKEKARLEADGVSGDELIYKLKVYKQGVISNKIVRDELDKVMEAKSEDARLNTPAWKKTLSWYSKLSRTQKALLSTGIFASVTAIGAVGAGVAAVPLSTIGINGLLRFGKVFVLGGFNFKVAKALDKNLLKQRNERFNNKQNEKISSLEEKFGNGEITREDFERRIEVLSLEKEKMDRERAFAKLAVSSIISVSTGMLAAHELAGLTNNIGGVGGVGHTDINSANGNNIGNYEIHRAQIGNVEHGVSTNFSVKLGEHGVPHNLETTYNEIAADRLKLADGGIVNEEFAGKSLNMAENLTKLTEGHHVAGIDPDDFTKHVASFDPKTGVLDIKDPVKFNEVVDKFAHRADDLWNKGVLQGKGGAVGYARNITPHSWVDIVHAKGLTETPSGLHTGIIGHPDVTVDKIVDFNHSQIVQGAIDKSMAHGGLNNIDHGINTGTHESLMAQKIPDGARTIPTQVAPAGAEAIPGQTVPDGVDSTPIPTPHVNPDLINQKVPDGATLKVNELRTNLTAGRDQNISPTRGVYDNSNGTNTGMVYPTRGIYNTGESNAITPDGVGYNNTHIEGGGITREVPIGNQNLPYNQYSTEHFGNQEISSPGDGLHDVTADPRHLENAADVRHSFGANNVKIEKPDTDTINGIPYEHWHNASDYMFREKNIHFNSFEHYEKESELQELLGHGRPATVYSETAGRNIDVVNMHYFRESPEWSIESKIPAKYFFDFKDAQFTNGNPVSAADLNRLVETGVLRHDTVMTNGVSTDNYTFVNHSELERLQKIYDRLTPRSDRFLGEPIGNETLDKYVERITQKVYETGNGTLYGFKENMNFDEMATRGMNSQIMPTSGGYIYQQGSSAMPIAPRYGLYQTSSPYNRRIADQILRNINISGDMYSRWTHR